MRLNRHPEFGQTPWDSLTRDQLFRFVVKYFSTLSTLRSALAMCRSDAGHPYWSEKGLGGRALVKAEECLREVARTDQQREAVYRSLFRYVDDLLFKNAALGRNWRVCPKCQSFTSRLDSPPEICHFPKCEGQKLRKLRWADLKPKEG